MDVQIFKGFTSALQTFKEREEKKGIKGKEKLNQERNWASGSPPYQPTVISRIVRDL